MTGTEVLLLLLRNVHIDCHAAGLVIHVQGFSTNVNVLLQVSDAPARAMRTSTPCPSSVAYLAAAHAEKFIAFPAGPEAGNKSRDEASTQPPASLCLPDDKVAWQQSKRQPLQSPKLPHAQILYNKGLGKASENSSIAANTPANLSPLDASRPAAKAAAMISMSPKQPGRAALSGRPQVVTATDRPVLGEVTAVNGTDAEHKSAQDGGMPAAVADDDFVMCDAFGD